MAKKRKLNSKNPKYLEKVGNKAETNQEKRFICNTPVRDVSGNVVKGVTVPTYVVFGQD